MRLRHIEIFEAIRRTGSLTEAAATLHITQPAASKLLANAEMQLGFKLFERVKGRLVATREAEILTPEIARLSQDLNGVRKRAASLRERPHGHLRLGCAPALGLGLLPQVIRASRDTRPGMTFDIQTHHSAELVQGLDLVDDRELDLRIGGVEGGQARGRQLVRGDRRDRLDLAGDDVLGVDIQTRDRGRHAGDGRALD